MIEQQYEVTPQRQFSVISTLLFYHSILIFLYLRTYGLMGNPTLLLCYVGFFMFDALPGIVMHIQYFLVNRNAIFTVNETDCRVSYTNDGENLAYSFDDIDQIIYKVGLGNGSFYSFSEYRYFVLVFKDGKRALISSLMMKYNQKKIEGMFGVKVKVKLSMWPFVKKSLLRPL